MINVIDVFSYNGTKLIYKASALILSANITSDAITNTISELKCDALDNQVLDESLMYWCRVQFENTTLFGSISNIDYDDLDESIFDCSFVEGVNNASVSLLQYNGDSSTATNATFNNLVASLNSVIDKNKEFIGLTNTPLRFSGTIKQVTLRFLFEAKVVNNLTYKVGVLTLDEVFKQIFSTYGIIPKIQITSSMIFDVSFIEYPFATNQRKVDISTHPVISYEKTKEFVGFGQAQIGLYASGSLDAYKLLEDGSVWQYAGYDMAQDKFLAKNIETGEIRNNWLQLIPYNLGLYVKTCTPDEFASSTNDALGKLRDNWASHSIKVKIDSSDVRYYINELGKPYILYENRKPIYTKLTAVNKSDDSLVELTFGYIRPKLSDQIREIKDNYKWR